MAEYNGALAEDCSHDYPEIPKEMGTYVAFVCQRCGAQVDTMPM